MGRVRAAACVLVLAACGGASQSNLRPLGGILSASPATLDFGDVALGREQTRPIVLRNDGLVSMTVNHLAQFSDPAFEVTGLPATLAPGSTIDVNVRYRPPRLGTSQRTLQIVTDSPESAGADVGLVGNAVRGLATLSGDAFDFGDVVVGQTATQDLLVTNNDGRAETAIQVGSPQDTTVFTVVPPGEQPIAAEGSMVVRIQFRPDQLVSYSSGVLVTPCPTCSPQRIALAGRGVASLLRVQPDTLDFGQVRLGGNAAQRFTVTNTSKSPLLVPDVTLSGSPDLTASLDGAPLPRTLGPGETAAGTARYLPLNLGQQQAQASFVAV